MASGIVQQKDKADTPGGAETDLSKLPQLPVLATSADPLSGMEAKTIPSDSVTLSSGFQDVPSAGQTNNPTDPAHVGGQGAPDHVTQKDNGEAATKDADNASTGVCEELDEEKLVMTAPLKRLQVTPATQRSGDVALPVSGGLPQLTPKQAHIARIPSPSAEKLRETEKHVQQRHSARAKYPPQMMRLATVTVATRQEKKPVQTGTVYNDHYPRHQKVIRWDEATNSRPPLPADLDGPTPVSYTPRNKPLYETNSPAWTFGRKSFVEKPGGSRRSWEKTWFQAESVWHQKADFFSDQKWPSPQHYMQRPTLGKRQNTITARVSPAYSIGTRNNMAISKHGAATEPSPNEYNKESSDVHTLRKAPAFSLGLRRGGTVLWASGEFNHTPGPGVYQPRRQVTFRHNPSFTIRGIRRERTHDLGPFSAF